MASIMAGGTKDSSFEGLRRERVKLCLDTA
jgi:hypothetical protein